MDIIIAENDETMDIDIENITKRCRIGLRRTVQSKKLCAKEERNASIKKVSLILQKSEVERTYEEAQMLKECSEAVEEVQLRWRKRDEAKRRLEEFEEPMDVLHEKCQLLAQAIAQSEHLVVYTGAGISTAAKIPDYRGTNGIWTMLQQGKDIGNHDLSLAEPTFTHMALSALYHKNRLKYVVSQNCDGLHLRSGLPRTALSELHGNMYIEVCKSCKPVKEYWRLFDVTENTARYSHKTMRKCYMCNGPLEDTIVHFGERGRLQWPLNWSGACKNARKATTILCLGSSLKVLKKYPWLWQMDKPVKKRPKLFIVNLQWTPKDDCANVKIHGKCDVVMEIVTKMLGIEVPKYDRNKDPIFNHCTRLCEPEYHTTTQPSLKVADEEIKKFVAIVKKEENVQNDHTNVYNKDCLFTPSNTSDHASPKNDSCTGTKTESVSCDKQSNSIINNYNFVNDCKQENISNLHQCLPENNSLEQQHRVSLQQNTKTNCSFSIDRILETNSNSGNKCASYSLASNCNTVQNMTLLQQNYQTIWAYYQFSNTLLQQQMFGCPELLYYPYQTSLMYSGLHNIIRPQTYFREEHNYTLTKPDLYKPDEIKTETVDPKCEFCNEHYNSVICLFYIKAEPVFLKKEFNLSKAGSDKLIVCLCCDYSTDEEENVSETGQDLDTENVLIEKDKNDLPEKETKSKIQAGWFGKGYRKNRRYKKR